MVFLPFRLQILSAAYFAIFFVPLGLLPAVAVMLQLHLHIGVPTAVAGVAHLVEALNFFLQNLQVACSIPILSNICFYIFASSNNRDEGSLFIPIKCRSLYTHKTNMSNFFQQILYGTA